MLSHLNTVLYLILDISTQLAENFLYLVWWAPLIFAYELPFMLLVILGIIRWYKNTFLVTPKVSLYRPKVSCIITCYSEGHDVKLTIDSLVEQTYPGNIEIIAVVDGAVQNALTYEVAMACAQFHSLPNRKVIVLPKWQRGGRVSTLNTGLHYASGELVINADADTSFDNNMVSEVVPYFEDPNVPALGGALRVRNIRQSILTRMQSIEYLISMQGGKTGTAQWNLLNNVSGAFGVFRRSFLIQIGGWDTHTAEDLDLTLRIKQYFKRNPQWKIPFATLAIGHTDVPVDLKTFLAQRLRWDGDLFFLYLRKHWQAFTPNLLGWKNFLYTLFYGLLQNVLMPFITSFYFLWLLWMFPWPIILAIGTLLYAVYLSFIVFFYLIVLSVISERVKEDLRLVLWLPVYPLYALSLWFVRMFALMNEVIRRSHEESNMAPWWVLKRGKKF
jgi:poly-beta-1,6-N-acetyl-D-glucosamine synthase